MGDGVLITPNFTLGYGVTTAIPNNYPSDLQSGLLLGGEVEVDYHPSSYFSSGGGVLFHHLLGGSEYSLLAAKPFFTFHLPAPARDDNMYGLKVGFPMGARTRVDDEFRFTGGLSLELFWNNPEVTGLDELNYSEGNVSVAFNFLQTPLDGGLESSILMALKVNFLGIFDSDNYSPTGE